MDELELPPNLPEIEIHKGFRETGLSMIAKAVTVAGLWADRSLRSSGRGGIVSKQFGDIATPEDRFSEHIMHYLLRRMGFTGRIIGEEIGESESYTLATSGTNQIAILDGLDGTENGKFAPDGKDSMYGPSLGTFYVENNVLKSSLGALYLPRQGRGFVGSTKTGRAFEFTIKDGRVVEFESLEPFDQERDDFHYITTCWPTGEDPNLPEWYSNLFRLGPQYSDQSGNAGQLIPRVVGSCVAGLAALVENHEEGKRRPNFGPAVYIVGKDVRLHDILGGASIVLALGGTISTLSGYKLGEDVGFVNYKRGIRSLVESQHIIDYQAGPLIIAQNPRIEHVTRELMQGRLP